MIKPLNIARKVFIGVFSISLISSVSLLTEHEHCKNNSDSTIYKACGIASILSSPGKSLLEGYISTYRLMSNYIRFSSFGTHGLYSVEPNITKDRFKDLSKEFTFNYKPEERTKAGYLILSRADPIKEGKPSVELWDMNMQRRIHTYRFDYGSINKLSEIKSDINSRYLHPLLLEDGSLIFNAYPSRTLIKVDKCGDYISHNAHLLFHHSIEMDELSRIYVPTRKRPEDIDLNQHVKDFWEEGFAVLDQDLEVLNEYWLLDIYKKEGLLADLYGRKLTPTDPFHLNDVEPFIRQDGSVIALLSLATQSSLLAYDIKENSLIWKIERATTLQHDIDVINQSNQLIEIGIFNNNAMNYVKGRSLGNEFVTFKKLPTKSTDKMLLIADKSTHADYEVNRLNFDSLEAKYRPKTFTEGRSDYLQENNSLMVEETNHGRLIEIDIDTKKILWQYVNQLDKNSSPYTLNWARRLKKLPGRLNESIFMACESNSKESIKF